MTTLKERLEIALAPVTIEQLCEELGADSISLQYHRRHCQEYAAFAYKNGRSSMGCGNTWEEALKELRRETR